VTQGQERALAAPATLTEVARLAGVSVATASRVLNGSARRPTGVMRDRVLTAAARLDYSPNVAAQAVARGRTNIVGLVVHGISDPYFATIAAGAIRAGDDSGIVMSIMDTEGSPVREIQYVAALRRQRARAVILAGSRRGNLRLQRELQEEIALFLAGGGQVAIIGQQLPGANTVLVENRAAARDLAETLCTLGYRSYVVLAGPTNLRTSTDRLAGFRSGLAKHGIPLAANRVVTTDFTRDGGYRAAEAFLASGLQAECLFAVNDVVAVGAMAALRMHGIHLPDDMAVAGFDDIPTLRDVVPHLTTVHIPLEALGTQAMALAVAATVDGAAALVRRFGGSVVVRESTPGLH